MVRVSGVVTRRTGVFPQLKIIMFDCAKCGHVLGPFTQVFVCGGGQGEGGVLGPSPDGCCLGGRGA